MLRRQAAGRFGRPAAWLAAARTGSCRSGWETGAGASAEEDRVGAPGVAAWRQVGDLPLTNETKWSRGPRDPAPGAMTRQTRRMQVRRGRAALCANPTLLIPTAVGVPLCCPCLPPLLFFSEHVCVLSSHGLAELCHVTVLANAFGQRVFPLGPGDVFGPSGNCKA